MNLDLHTHTYCSADALSLPESALKAAEKKGVAIAVTEHDNTKSWPVFRELSKRFPERVIFGQEVSVLKEGRSAGHFLGLFLQEEIKSRDYLQVIDEVKAQDAMLCIAHPFDLFRTPCSCLDEVKKEIDLLEAFNSRTYFNSFNKKAEAFALKNKLAMAAGSDAHIPQEIGNAYTIVDAGTLEEARAKLKKGETTVAGKGSGLFPHVMTMLTNLKLASPR